MNPLDIPRAFLGCVGMAIDIGIWMRQSTRNQAAVLNDLSDIEAGVDPNADYLTWPHPPGSPDAVAASFPGDPSTAIPPAVDTAPTADSDAPSSLPVVGASTSTAPTVFDVAAWVSDAARFTGGLPEDVANRVASCVALRIVDAMTAPDPNP